MGKTRDKTHIIFKPQPGPQEAFLSSSADIVLYGGAAGSGKTFAMILETLRHVTKNAEFSAVIFRRSTTQVRNPGGLWDESLKLYPYCGGNPVAHLLEWRWKKGGKVKMAHLEHGSTVLDWQGAQIPLIMFDELTHFLENQFFYMLSRNRSLSGIRPCIRASTNPDADSWVAALIAWWIEQDPSSPNYGYPIPERSGVIRWFIRINDSLIWGDSRQELIGIYGSEVEPKSFTFIPAKLADNKILMEADPGYRANLMALSRVERERLLGGNWAVRVMSGMYFKRSEVNIVDIAPLPHDIEMIVRKWDLAATEPCEGNQDPDWTVGVKMGRLKNGRYIVLDIIRERVRSSKVRELVLRMARNDSIGVTIGINQDPGQAGVDQANSYIQLLAGFKVEVERETGDKVTRADPFAAQWQNGNVDILRATWNEAYFKELEDFPGTGHDDQVDGSSGAFNMLTKDNLSVWASLGRK